MELIFIPFDSLPKSFLEADSSTESNFLGGPRGIKRSARPAIRIGGVPYLQKCLLQPCILIRSQKRSKNREHFGIAIQNAPEDRESC